MTDVHNSDPSLTFLYKKIILMTYFHASTRNYLAAFHLSPRFPVCARSYLFLEHRRPWPAPQPLCFPGSQIHILLFLESKGRPGHIYTNWTRLDRRHATHTGLLIRIIWDIFHIQLCMTMFWKRNTHVLYLLLDTILSCHRVTQMINSANRWAPWFSDWEARPAPRNSKNGKCAHTEYVQSCKVAIEDPHTLNRDPRLCRLSPDWVLRSYFHISTYADGWNIKGHCLTGAMYIVFLKTGTEVSINLNNRDTKEG